MTDRIEVRIKLPRELVAEMTKSEPGSSAREAFETVLGRIAFDALLASQETDE